jgi:Cys-tRNA(Pro)/Cys-tRNA(Cys) deacylase
MARSQKTLAMRVLEGQNVSYEVVAYPDTIHDAYELSQHVGLPPENVYKTLVVQAEDPGFRPMLILVASDRTLNLKVAARAVGAKKVHMARHMDAERLTGLKVGGISALALLNKGFDIYLDEWATLLEFIVISAGQRGLNLKLCVDDLIHVTGAQVIEVSDN